MTDNGNHNKWKSAHEWQPYMDKTGQRTHVDVAALSGNGPRLRAKEVSVPPGISVAEYRIASRTREDVVNEKALNSLSPERREVVEQAMYDIRVNGAGGKELAHPVYGGRKSLIREAAAQGTQGVGAMMGRGDSTHLMPSLYSPLWLTANLQLPRDRITANAWNRAFYETNPFVRNAINLHATYPISKMLVKCRDKKYEQKYNDMCDQIDIFTVVQQVALEFWKMGEVFPYANLNERTGMWDSVYVHNPDYILVQETLIHGQNVIALKPHPKLRKLVESQDPAMRAVREQLDPKIIDAVNRNEYLPLDNFNVSHLKNESAPYEMHGQSIITSVWKDLVLWDMFRENKFIQADAMVNPMTLVKVGASNPDGLYPTKEYLAAYRDIFEEAQYNKDFKVFTHGDVTVERVGYNSGVLDIAADLNMLIDNIFIGLMVPKSIMTQEGSSYATASVALDVIRQRYNNFRSKIENWLIKKIFAPIAEINGWYKYEAKTKRLILPEIEWNRMTLYDVDTYIQHLTGLLDKESTGKPSGVSKTTIYHSLGLDFQDEVANQKREAIEMAILEKEMQEIGKMSISALRALDPTKPILETNEEPLPGVADEEGGDGGDGLDALGLPPLPSPGGDEGGGGGDDIGAPPGGGGDEPPLPPPAG